MQALREEQNNVDRLCARFISCDVFDDLSQCRDNLSVYVLPEACKNELLKNPDDQCPQFYSRKIEQLCFPSCSMEEYTCEGDFLTACEDGSQYRIDCYNYCLGKTKFQAGRKLCGHDSEKGRADCLCK